MKLTNQQIDALANKIMTLADEGKDEINRQLRANRKELIDKLISKSPILKEYNEYWFRKNGYYPELDAFIVSKYKSQFDKFPKEKSHSSIIAIKNDIIINSIESDDVESLIKELVKKYK